MNKILWLSGCLLIANFAWGQNQETILERLKRLENLAKEQSQQIIILQRELQQLKRQKDRVIFRKKFDKHFKASKPNTWIEVFNFIPDKDVKEIILRGVINCSLVPTNQCHSGVSYKFNNTSYQYNVAGNLQGASVILPIYCHSIE